jgi:hypothetical protein
MKLIVLRSLWASMAVLALGALTYVGLGRYPGAAWAVASAGAEPAGRQSSLDEDLRDVVRRSEGRRRVVDDVIAGRLSLAAAAARFQELDEASATFNWDRFRAVNPGETDLEKQCHAVILHVQNLLVNEPDRQRAVTGRLEEERRALSGGVADTAPGSAPPAGQLASHP